MNRVHTCSFADWHSCVHDWLWLDRGCCIWTPSSSLITTIALDSSVTGLSTNGPTLLSLQIVKADMYVGWSESKFTWRAWSLWMCVRSVCSSCVWMNRSVDHNSVVTCDNVYISKQTLGEKRKLQVSHACAFRIWTAFLLVNFGFKLNFYNERYWM